MTYGQMGFSPRPAHFPRNLTLLHEGANLVVDDFVDISLDCWMVCTHNSNIYRLVTLFVCTTKIRKIFELTIQKSENITLF